MLWFQSKRSHNLEHQYQQLLWRKSHNAEEGLISFIFLKCDNYVTCHYGIEYSWVVVEEDISEKQD